MDAFLCKYTCVDFCGFVDVHVCGCQCLSKYTPVGNHIHRSNLCGCPCFSILDGNRVLYPEIDDANIKDAL